jgi:hypothetical protein
MKDSIPLRDSHNPYGAALAVIQFLGGDPKTGKCFCPCHDDGEKPSLVIGNGDKVPVVLHCWGVNTKEHDLEIIAYLRAQKVLPTTDRLSAKRVANQDNPDRKPEQRRLYACRIWRDLMRWGGVEFAPFLRNYLEPRGITEVPSVAMLSLPSELMRGDAIGSSAPAMVLPVRNRDGKLQGVHVVWLNGSLTGKRDVPGELQRQSFGLIQGNFIQLSRFDRDEPPPVLIIGEGVETVLAMMQLTGLPGIATSGKGFFKDLEPPRCGEYIIAVDADADGGSRTAAGMLAQRLVGAVVRIATPDKPEGGKDGYDWNDALIDGRKDADRIAELKRAIIEAPLFETVMTKSEARDIRINALAEVMRANPLDYEQARTSAAEDLGMRVGVLDAEVASRAKKLEEQEQAAPPPVDVELLAASARDIIASNDVLGLLIKAIGKYVVGEEELIKLIFLAGTSRLFAKGMHIGVRGPSAGGKSEVRKRVLAFFPEESVISFTALSERALPYYKEGFEHKILSMGEAQGPDEAKLQDYLLRELMSESKLRYPVAMKVGGRIETVIIEKNGPVVFIVTTTRTHLNLENETRMLAPEIDDSAEQTARVIQKIAEVEGYGREPAPADFTPWHDFQRWLAAGECRVHIPFARTLGKLITSTRSVRLRRDFPQLLRAIQAHALIHREHRKRNEDGALPPSRMITRRSASSWPISWQRHQSSKSVSKSSIRSRP